MQLPGGNDLQTGGTKSSDVAAILLRHETLGQSRTSHAATFAATNQRATASQLQMDHHSISHHYEMFVWVLEMMCGWRGWWEGVVMRGEGCFWGYVAIDGEVVGLAITGHAVWIGWMGWNGGGGGGGLGIRCLPYERIWKLGFVRWIRIAPLDESDG